MVLTDKHITSEEKLLKLIRRKNTSGSEGEKRRGGRLSSRDSSGEEREPFDLLSLVNRLLMVLAVGTAGFIVIKYFFFKPDSALRPLPSEIRTAGIPPVSVSAKAAAVKDFGAYQQRLQARDFFEAPWEKPAAGAPAGADPALEISKQFKVVGILLDDAPQAIIEDINSKQTFFVSVGEHLGEAAVEEIREDKVILIFHEERVELAP